jgi:asparagine synthase (glutamine-hydrolysing)
MCGIAGCVVAPGEEPRREALAALAAALSHRGPDDQGVLISGNVGLVNTRLAIVDPSAAGHQPMADPSGRWLLTYNGEVFNHRALREQLPIDKWRGDSDTETLLAALDEWDEDALPRCNGFFALAALDVRNGRLLLARDRFGKKPLYLARHDGGLWFASEMRALLAAGVPAKPQPDVLAYAASVRWAAGRQTPIEGFERLPPGGLLRIDTKTLASVERRWFEPANLVDTDLAAELKDLGRAQLGERLEGALHRAVSRRLLGDAPIGTALSGGLDSTLVTAMAHREDRSIVAFNASLVDESRADEGPWAEHAARALGVELDTVRITTPQWRAALVGAVAHHEYPLRSGATAASVSMIARRARERGVKVLLVGEAADELFGGYPIVHGATFHRFLSRSEMLRRLVEAARRPGGVLAVGRAILAHLRGTPAGLAALDPPAEVARWADSELRSARIAYWHHPGARGELEATLMSEMTAGSLPFLLNRMDKDVMAHSVETRVPFLDRELVELAVNLPLEHRVAPAPKGVLRDVARRWIPEGIVRRPKQAGMVFASRRRIEEAARPEFLRHGYLRDALRLSLPEWDGLLETTRDRTRLWTGEIWCRLFLEGHGVAGVERDLWIPEQVESPPEAAIAAG